MRISIENFTKTFGDTTVIENMSLEIADGEMMALLGPSGCGKSTTLFAICGIHRMDGGRLMFGDKDVTRTSSQDRNAGVVFQNYALYPHMNIFENIAFPLTVRKESKATIDRKVQDIADLVHIGELLKRRPAQLSGGQQQRVALARALVREPDILLLDEPLANLDAKLRLEMRSEIRRIQLATGITAVLVTHDQVEAMSMCDRIAIMDKGQIVQLSAPKDMYENPSSAFVAGFLGNPPIAFLEGTAADGSFRLANSQVTLPVPSGIAVPGNGAPMRFGIRPEFFQPDNPLKVPGKVTFVESHGREELYDVTLENGSVLRSIQPQSGGYKPGDEVNWGIAQDRVLAFGPDGKRL